MRCRYLCALVVSFVLFDGCGQQQKTPPLFRLLTPARPAALSQHEPGLREGWAWAPRQWHQVTDDTGVGNPVAATPEKGRKYTDAVSEKIAGFLVELARAETQDLYE